MAVNEASESEVESLRDTVANLSSEVGMQRYLTRAASWTVVITDGPADRAPEAGTW